MLDPDAAPKPAQAQLVATASPPGSRPNQACGGAEQRRTDTGIGGNRAHQQEHRDRGQIPTGGEHERRVAQDAERDIEIAQVPKPEERDAAHGDADRNAQPDQDQHGDKAGAGDRKRAHDRSACDRSGGPAAMSAITRTTR